MPKIRYNVNYLSMADHFIGQVNPFGFICIHNVLHSHIACQFKHVRKCAQVVPSFWIMEKKHPLCYYVLVCISNYDSRQVIENELFKDCFLFVSLAKILDGHCIQVSIFKTERKMKKLSTNGSDLLNIRLDGKMRRSIQETGKEYVISIINEITYAIDLGASLYSNCTGVQLSDWLKSGNMKTESLLFDGIESKNFV